MRRDKQTAPVLTVEATAKRWKAIQLAGAGIITVGLICLAFFMSAGSELPLRVTGLILFAGLCTTIYGTFMAWWHHG